MEIQLCPSLDGEWVWQINPKKFSANYIVEGVVDEAMISCDIGRASRKRKAQLQIKCWGSPSLSDQA